MTVRERLEEKERMTLAPWATPAALSAGREREEPPCAIRTSFMRDRDRIIHSKAFRRLKFKTQVFLAPEGDHYRTRLTHTLEVSQIARTVARAVGANEDLTEAAALGHDLGHTPFGHAGEKALDAVCPYGFRHNEQSLRVVETLEKDGAGLNLTREVRDGILCHTGDRESKTPEGCILRYADRIAYINHDIDDSIRAGILAPCDIPAHLSQMLGKTASQRINTLVNGMVSYTGCTGKIGMETELYEAMMELRQFMFRSVYTNPKAKSEELKGIDILKQLYLYYQKHTEKLSAEYQRIAETDGKDRAACDYIAGMTDRYAIACFNDLFIPRGWAIR